MTNIEPKAFALYEDRPNWQELLRDILEGRGHTVAIMEDRKRNALATIKVETYKEKRVFGALVDGQLLGGPMGNLDGIELADAIIALNLGIHIASIAGNPLPQAEFAINKSDFDDRVFKKYLESIGA